MPIDLGRCSGICFYAYISNGKKHDVTVARKFSLPPDSIVVMPACRPGRDRAYNDYKLLSSWTENHVYFVTRMKDNAQYAVIEDNTVPISGNVLSDQVIEFTGFYACKNCPHPLRRIVVWDTENE